MSPAPPPAAAEDRAALARVEEEAQPLRTGHLRDVTFARLQPEQLRVLLSLEDDPP
jgi:hypothetical protein